MAIRDFFFILFLSYHCRRVPQEAASRRRHSALKQCQAPQYSHMRSGSNWIHMKWVVTSQRLTWRAVVHALRLIRDPWNSVVSNDFNYRVEFTTTKGVDRPSWALPRNKIKDTFLSEYVSMEYHLNVVSLIHVYSHELSDCFFSSHYLIAKT